MSLVSRAQDILVRPNTEWPVIAAEPAAPAAILAGYVLPLAAIGPIASFAGSTIVGVQVPFVGTIRIGFVAGITNAVVSYVFAVAGVLFIAAIVNALAPSFGATRSWIASLKLTAYALTPAFLAGILGVIPVLGILGLLAGLYGLYLFFIGLPVVMNAPRDRSPIYALAVFGCAFVVGLVFGALSFAVHGAAYALGGGFGTPGLGADSANAAERSAAVGALAAAVGGNAADQEAAKNTVDAVSSAAAQAQAQQADPNASADPGSQAAAGLGMLKAMVSGGKNVAVVPRDRMASLLPASLGDMTRSDAQGSTSSVAGMKGSKAVADFKDANGSLHVEVSDLGNAAGLALLAGSAANMVESENDDGYEKNVDVGGGRKVHESWKNANKHSELLEIVDSRFAVAVTGDGVDMDDALKALQSIDVAKMRDLAAAAK